ncbi:MAG: C39 family peptidase [Planctomycetes bacterium]|nr:C39 family peptidase [Planctomycetota bacterium]
MVRLPLGAIPLLLFPFLVEPKEANGQQPNPLRTALFGQEKPNWCWAACSEMISDYNGKRKKQKDQVIASYGREADVPGWPDFDWCGFKFRRQGNPLTWQALKAEIDSDRPFCYAKRPVGGGNGHMLVVVGYTKEKMLILLDPWPVNRGQRRRLAFEEYQDESDAGFEHWQVFFEIQVKP